MSNLYQHQFIQSKMNFRNKISQGFPDFFTSKTYKIIKKPIDKNKHCMSCGTTFQKSY